MGVNIIFVDVDGVLNTEYTQDRCDGYIGIEDKFVANLRKIIDSTENCRIVLSSTWRLGLTRYGDRLQNHMKYLNDKLHKQGLEIYSVTPDLSTTGNSRGKEIYTWLQEHDDLDIKSWVVLDDEYFWDFSDYGINQHWVATDFYSRNGGLNNEKVKEAIRVLQGGLPNDTR